MEYQKSAIIVGVILVALLIVLFVVKMVRALLHFNRETRYIADEMTHAGSYKEYKFWRRELRCHYLCLIPFVNADNVINVYRFFFHRSKKQPETEKRNDGIFHILAPSIIGAFICLVCLCGASWAWFTATTATATSKIQTAQYTVSVEATGDNNEVCPTTTDEKGVVSFSLNDNDKYKVTITATGTARNGYCIVNLGDNNYYTDQLTGDAILTFTVYKGTADKITITPQWGTRATDDGKIIQEGGVFGEKPSDSQATQAAPDSNESVQQSSAASTAPIQEENSDSDNSAQETSVQDTQENEKGE